MGYHAEMEVAAKAYFKKLLEECDGSVTRVAQAAELNRQYTHDLLGRLGLKASSQRGNLAWRELGSPRSSRDRNARPRRPIVMLTQRRRAARAQS